MIKQSILLLILLCGAHWAFANDVQTVTERQRLESVMNELTYIQNYLQDTKSTQKHNVRSRFDYKRVGADIDLIKNGIAEYLNDIPSKPKGAANTLREIDGNYKQ